MEALHGNWAPCSRILYGIVTYPFQPLAVKEHQVPTAQDQVALEIGDEVYALEVFRPDAAPSQGQAGAWDGTWHRGYAVTGQKSQNPESSHAEAMQVFFGLWPSAHVQIREELDHVPLQTTTNDALSKSNGSVGATELSRSASGSQRFVMDTLKEEDEDAIEEAEATSKRVSSASLLQSASGQQQRNRLSLTSLTPAVASAIAGHHKRTGSGSSIADACETALHPPPAGSLSPSEGNKPQPPLPSLKCGDETASGMQEPLVDEVACALREWSQLLFTHLSKRNYALFTQIKEEMDVLHVSRRQLLSGALSQKEAEHVRRDLVQRLVKGNHLQGLDLIVRHPQHGSLIEIDEPGPSWASVIQLYSMQAKLAHSTASALRRMPQSSSHMAAHASELFSRPVSDNKAGSSAAPPAHKRNFSIDDTKSVSGLARTSAPASAFYHVYLDVRGFAAAPCPQGELTELNFSIYNASESRFVSEEFCVVLRHNGLPVHLPPGMMHTLFKDLTSQDLLESLFLVCRITRNGSFKSLISSASSNNLLAATANGSDSQSHSRESSRMSFVSPDDASTSEHKSSMLRTLSSSGQQSARRPFGCAVLSLGFLQATDQSDPASANVDERTIPVFFPNTENAFANLHQDIIASRTSNFTAAADKARSVSVHVKLFHGVATDILQTQPELSEFAPETERLGFPDVVEPEMQRNDLYLRLETGNFDQVGSATSSGSGTLRRGLRGIQQLANSSASAVNVEVSLEVRHSDGSIVEQCISRGSGEPLLSSFTSIIVKGNTNPVFNELLKLVMKPEWMETCHLFFTFRNRTSKERSMSGVTDKPIAFAWLPLFPDTVTCLSDGTHRLALYRYVPEAAKPSFYSGVSPISTAPDSKRLSSLPPSQLSLLTNPSALNLATPPQTPPSQKAPATPQPLKDTLVITSLSCSTDFTQDETLLKLLRWHSSQISLKAEEMSTVLSKLKYCSETELAKHIQPVLDALFATLTSKLNTDGQLNLAVFGNLVAIFAIVSDRRFHNFRLIVDRYLAERFQFTAYSHLLRGMYSLLSARSDDGEAPQALRAAIKVWPLLFHTIIRSRELQRSKTVGSDVTSDSIEAAFKRELLTIFQEINKIMVISSPPSIVGTQVLAMQHFAGIIESVGSIFTHEELLEVVTGFCEAISGASGKLATHKLLLLARLSEGPLLNSSTNRATLVPDLLRWVKPHLAPLNVYEMRSLSDPAKINHHIQWIEGGRAAITVVAAMVHKLHVALLDPVICAKESFLAGEQDNLEFILALLPRLLSFFEDLRIPQSLDVIRQNPSQVAAASATPSIFPTSHPFYLLSRTFDADDTDSTGSELSLRHIRGECAAVVISLLHLVRTSVITNFLEATLEVEGPDNFTKLLSSLFRFSRLVIEGDAFPSTWLNFDLVSHRVALRTIESLMPIMIREYIPGEDSTFLFNFALWREYLDALFTLLKSQQLVIEEFAPQKRRTVWRQAGDLRGAGAKLLGRLWDCLGWPDQRLFRGKTTKLGGYQVQLGPPFIDSVLELCLSHHDELRSTAVHVLFTTLIGESRLNSDLTNVQNQVIDTLDRLFSQKKGDEVSRTFFVNHLRSLFEGASIDAGLHAQIDRFLDSTSHFLDLLLGIRNLPPGDEYLVRIISLLTTGRCAEDAVQDDRIIGTLRLMSYIRDISSSQIFSKYVHRLKDYHVHCGNYTEAGLVLKLHADLYDYSTSTYVDAFPDFDLPRQSSFARKEALYLQILELLNRGKAWESALVLCKELQERYELVNFAYQRLAEILLHQSTLYSNIVKEPRTYPNCFRVGYYGRGFPSTVQNRQFVYRGNEHEKLGAFRERHMNKHVSSILLDSQAIPDESIQNSDGQYIQICQVTPEPDRSFPIFQNQDVPPAVRSYYEHNGTNTFVFETKYTKSLPQRGDAIPADFVSTWYLRTTLTCADAFPTVLKRTEVIDTAYQETSPVEKALSNVEKSTSDLQTLGRKYTALFEEGVSPINANPLSMALNAVVDPGQHAGVPLYRKAFFEPDFVVAYPQKAGLVSHLRTSIDELTITIDRALRLHGHVCAPDMLSFHETLQSFFEQNFSNEIRRLLPETQSVADNWDNRPGSPLSQTTASAENAPSLPALASANAPVLPSKNKNRYSMSLSAETFGDSDPAAQDLRQLSLSTSQQRPESPGTIPDNSSVFSDTSNAPKVKRAGSLLRFGSITARKPKSTANGG